MAEDLLDQYRKYGYAVARGVFDSYEIAELTHAFERVHDEAMLLGRSYRLQNAFFKINNDAALRPVVRYVQWPSYFNRTLDRYRRSPRVLKFLAPMLGINLKQITNQIHWKHPGTANMECAFHQDSKTLRPRDVALWSPYTLHGSGPNRSNAVRGFYINSYIIAGNTNRGEWAFRNGVSQPLSGPPAMVDYDELYEKPGPMFVD